ncbi:hypothetical protein AVEN_125016-1 [Araneus ventricosus]|uniref:Uncharacterized protein n=1 Tax=Araneus ventricosus TaxID=182803 RepID=A0A4Y2GZ06_ARAVE|nr:hypothetical protein AVEN_125016-1 [Araneus ventricosus]
MLTEVIGWMHTLTGELAINSFGSKAEVVDHFSDRLEEVCPINARRLLDATAGWFKREPRAPRFKATEFFQIRSTDSLSSFVFAALRAFLPLFSQH